MKIIVNGQEKQIQEKTTIKKLLQDLNIEDKTMAAAVNMQVVKKEDWDKKELKENDKVEFLQFVGGG